MPRARANVELAFPPRDRALPLGRIPIESETSMGLMDILSQYAGQALSGGQPQPQAQQSAHDDFAQVATQAPPELLGGGIAQALEGSAGGFESSIAKLFENSDPQQRAGLLQRLIPAIGPGVLSSFAGGALNHLGQPGAQVQPSDADAITPAQAGELAAAAKQSNPGIVSELGSFYSQHPTLVKTLGGAALAIAMSHMASHV